MATHGYATAGKWGGAEGGWGLLRTLNDAMIGATFLRFHPDSST
jgi:hypothetical protein